MLNDATVFLGTYAAHSRTQSHDYIAKFSADLAIQYGIPTSVKNVPFANSNRYLADYHDQGLAFAPLVCNSLGQLGPDFQNFLWALADHVAKNQFSANLLDKQCIDSQTANQATFRKLRSLLY